MNVHPEERAVTIVDIQENNTPILQNAFFYLFT